MIEKLIELGFDLITLKQTHIGGDIHLNNYILVITEDLDLIFKQCYEYGKITDFYRIEVTDYGEDFVELLRTNDVERVVKLIDVLK